MKRGKNSRLSESDVRLICELLEDGVGQHDIAKCMKVTGSTISAIKRGINYSNISKDYNFKR